MVEALQGALQPPSVTVDYRRGGLVLGDGTWVPLAPADLGFYGWLAARTRAGLEAVRIPGGNDKRWTAEQRGLYEGYYTGFRAATRDLDLREGTGQDMKALGAMTKQFFLQRKSGIRKALEEAVGPLADAYAVHNLTGEARLGGYGLRIAPGLVRVLK